MKQKYPTSFALSKDTYNLNEPIRFVSYTHGALRKDVQQLFNYFKVNPPSTARICPVI